MTWSGLMLRRRLPDSTAMPGNPGRFAVALERAVEEGHRPAQIDAHDLIEVLLAIADRLDPPVTPYRSTNLGIRPPDSGGAS